MRYNSVKINTDCIDYAQEIGPAAKEQTSVMLHVECCIIRIRNMDYEEYKNEVFGNLPDVVLEKKEKHQMGKKYLRRSN